MPLYEYQCTNCRERVEILQRASDQPSLHCPKCGGEMKKLLSAPAIQFKGSGFYKTDYGSGSKGGESKSKSSSETSESKSETKSESKNESKNESKSDAKSESRSESKSESKSDGSTTKSD